MHAGLQLEHLVLRETGIFEFLIVCFFYLATRPAPTTRNLALMTLICIAAYYTRATGVLLLAALVLFVVFLPAATCATWKTRAKILAATVGTVIVAAVRGRYTRAAPQAD